MLLYPVLLLSKQLGMTEGEWVLLCNKEKSLYVKEETGRMGQSLDIITKTGLLKDLQKRYYGQIRPILIDFCLMKKVYVWKERREPVFN